MNHPFPQSLIAAEAPFTDVFFRETTSFGISQFDADRLLKKIPASVRNVKAIKFVFGETWRYLYGKRFHFSGNSHGFGVPYQAPLVVNLIRATLLAERVLTDRQFRHWWRQLDNPGKHFDAIVEMLAVFNIKSEHQLIYEQMGLGVGSQKIDWLIKTDKKGSFLLEVKNRPGQMAKEMSRMQTTSTAMPNAPFTDFTALFKSTSNKFLPLQESAFIQGAILFLSIKVPSTALEIYFRDHLQSYFHFIALAKEDEASGLSIDLITNTPEIRDIVSPVFRWQEDANLIQ